MKLSTTTLITVGMGVLIALGVGALVLRRPPPPEPFERVNRFGSVNLDEAYDLSGLSIPRDEIHTLLEKDAIPSIDDPELLPIDQIEHMRGDDRVIEITINTQSIAVPLKILNYHEVINTTVGGVPVAATYCPLCDSVSVFERTVTPRPTEENPQPEPVVLEFGVTGALYNSNVLMYDRTHRGLWSQLGLRAVSGPMVGTELRHLPVRVVPFAQYRLAHPRGKTMDLLPVSLRMYNDDPYAHYFEDKKRLIVPVRSHGDELPMKTLGLGIVAGEEAYFVPANAIRDRFVVRTAKGELVASRSQAGVRVESSPQGVHSVQSFYYAFSAFHPHAEVVRKSE